jgi:hypothetical protein
MQNQKIIVINGAAQAGKDTFVQLFMKHAQVCVFEWSTITTVKAVAGPAFGWDGEKDEPGRRFLSDLKDAWTRYNDGPFKEVCDKIRYYDRRFERYVLFIHVREPEEILKIVNAYPDRVTTLEVVNRRVPVPGNHADQNAHKFNYHITVDNSTSLEVLEMAARHFAGALGQ